jgi:1,4-alpha-glucan branching enzyme
MNTSVDPEALRKLVEGSNGAPFDLLGPHPAEDDTVSIRAFRPDARSVAIKLNGTGVSYEMARFHEDGFFEATIPGAVDVPYQLALTLEDGTQTVIYDPYRYGTWLSNAELYHFGEGRFWHSYQKFGAQLTVVEGVPGVAFALWAPHAARVSVIGDFNEWDARLHPMRRRPGNGVWELFIPGMGEGELYRYDVLTTYGERLEKTDPYGFWTELRPATASITASMWYTWGDGQWMDSRQQRQAGPGRISIYQVHPGTWMRGEDGDWLDYQQIGQHLVNYCLSMGYTHLALTPIAEYPEDATLGYVTGGFYAVTSRYGSPLDFMRFVDYCHQNHIGVLLDWCPAQFASGSSGLENFDGTPLFEHPEPMQVRHPLWGTLAFNHANPSVRNFLLSNALFWLEMYHLDGLRLDRVSAMLYRDYGRGPGQWAAALDGSNVNEDAVKFLRSLNEGIHDAVPGVLMIADEATGWPGVTAPTAEGGLGFDLMWQTRWSRDVLEFLTQDADGRRDYHQRLVGAINPGEKAVLALSHRDVQMADGALINRMSGDEWQQRASLRLLLGLQMTMPGWKWTFMGTEFGVRQPWAESTPLDWSLLEDPAHRTLQYWVFDLHRLQAASPALTELDFEPEGFRWIEPNDAANGVYTYARLGKTPADFLLIVAHVQPVLREGYRVGAPAGAYEEILNSDSVYYGGGNIGNGGGHHQAETQPWQGQPASLVITLPPLSVLIFKPVGAVNLPHSIVEVAEAPVTAAEVSSPEAESGSDTEEYVDAADAVVEDDQPEQVADAAQLEDTEPDGMSLVETVETVEQESLPDEVSELPFEDEPGLQAMTAQDYIGGLPEPNEDDAAPLPLTQDAIETEEVPRLRLNLPDAPQGVLDYAEPITTDAMHDAETLILDPEPLNDAEEESMLIVDASPEYAAQYEIDDDGYISLPLTQSELPMPYYIGEATVVAFDDQSLMALAEEERLASLEDADLIFPNLLSTPDADEDVEDDYEEDDDDADDSFEDDEEVDYIDDDGYPADDGDDADEFDDEDDQDDPEEAGR